MSKTTVEYLDKQIRRAELSLRRAMRKPNTPPEELEGLNDKLLCLHEAKMAVEATEKGNRIHGKWEHGAYVCGETEWKCSQCGETEWRTSCSRLKFCPFCGAKMDLEAHTL